jgi:hypothetical protein
MLHRIVALALFASGAALAQAPATPAAKLPFTIERSPTGGASWPRSRAS